MKLGFSREMPRNETRNTTKLIACATAFTTALSVWVSPLTVFARENIRIDEIKILRKAEPPPALVDAVDRIREFLAADYQDLLKQLRSELPPEVYADFEFMFYAALSRVQVDYDDISRPAVYVVGEGRVKIDVDAVQQEVGGELLHEILHALVDLVTNPGSGERVLPRFRYEGSIVRINSMLEEGIVEYVNRMLIDKGIELGQDLGNCSCAYKSAVILYAAVGLDAITNEDIVRMMIYRDVIPVREKFDEVFGPGSFDIIFPAYDVGAKRPRIGEQDIMTGENFRIAVTENGLRDVVLDVLGNGVMAGRINQSEFEAIKSSLE